MDGNLIVASSRLPVTLANSEGQWSAALSAGGLVTALKPVATSVGFDWIGWPGVAVPKEQESQVAAVLTRAAHTIDGRCQINPVFLSQEQVSGFYTGFSNSTVWPLFHGFPSRTVFSTADYETYVAVNALFADKIAEHAKPDDIIWLHDYQLLLVPQMLRDRGLTNPIGFFLHIPFPSSETYRTLPVRQELLNGLLGADFLAFHAYEYVSHFRKSCLRVLGLDSDTDQIRTRARKVRLGVLPIGIDPDEVRALASTAEAQAEYEALTQSYPDKRIILGVDRLDYTKGIPEKLLAYEELLKQYPRWHRETVLIQVAAPSRTDVDDYQSLKRHVDELVGRINGQYGSPDHTPIIYINQYVSRERLAGMYRAADVALVTPVRDGMNLVALEYVAARGKAGGHLILSEFAGAANFLPEARLVNPYSTMDVSSALNVALESEISEGRFMHEFVETNTAVRWGEQFIERLEAARSTIQLPRRLKVPALVNRFADCKELAFFLDYDGTLRSYERNPKRAAPDERLRDTLRRLSEIGRVFVVSGRDEATLQGWLGDLPISLACEHGYALRQLGGQWEHRCEVDPTVLAKVRAVFDEFVRRTPGARVETKRSALAWHYRTVDAELGAFRSKELVTELAEVLNREPYTLLRGNKVVEVRHMQCTKGRAIEEFLRRYPGIDGIFCAGDDQTDEEMLEALQGVSATTVCCWVGTANALAEYWTDTTTALVGELGAFAETRGAQ